MMENRNICIMRYDLEDKKFRVFGLEIFDLDIIPRIGEKIVFDNERAIIAEVLDVHYSENGDVDIFIGKERFYIDYKKELDRNYFTTLDSSTE